MSVHEFFQALFSGVSELLLYPVLVLLFLIFAVSLWLAGRALGRFCCEAMARRKAGKAPVRREDVSTLLPCGAERSSPSGTAAVSDAASSSFGTGGASEADIELRLQREEQSVMLPVERLRLMTRLAPALGLMGTLIPMCEALAALMDGKLEKVAGNLIVAFGTTIVGLASACICFVLLYFEQRRALDRVRRLEYDAEKLFASRTYASPSLQTQRDIAASPGDTSRL